MARRFCRSRCKVKVSEVSLRDSRKFHNGMYTNLQELVVGDRGGLEEVRGGVGLAGLGGHVPHGRRVRRLQPAAALRGRGRVAVVESRRRRSRTPAAVVLNSKMGNDRQFPINGDTG